MARMKPASTFFAGYSAASARRLDDRGCSLLLYALGNKDLPSRYEISNVLLDDDCPLGGPGSGGATVLHVLFAQVKHDIAQDISLARRLIERGADVNAPDKVGRTPLWAAVDYHTPPQSNRPAPDPFAESTTALDVIKNLLAHGARVDAPLTAQIRNHKDWYDAYANKGALKRWAQPHEMAGMVVYLASDASSYATGGLYYVDGGWTAQDGRFTPPL